MDTLYVEAFSVWPYFLRVVYECKQAPGSAGGDGGVWVMLRPSYGLVDRAAYVRMDSFCALAMHPEIPMAGGGASAQAFLVGARTKFRPVALNFALRIKSESNLLMCIFKVSELLMPTE